MEMKPPSSLSACYTEVGLEGGAGVILRKGMRDPESLSEENLADFIFLLHGGMLLYQNAFVLGQEGTLDSSLQAVTLGTLSAIIQQPGFRLYWAQRQTVFTSSFREYVESLPTCSPNADQLAATVPPALTNHRLPETPYPASGNSPIVSERFARSSGARQ